MGKRPALSVQEIIQIDRLHGGGRSARAVGRELGRSADVVLRYLRLGADYGIRKYKKRKTKLSQRQKAKIIRKASNEIISSAQIKYNNNLPVHRQTVWRVLKSAPHLKFKKLKGKPPLTNKHKQARLERAEEWMAWTTEWNKVVFSDEKNSI